MEIKKGKKFTVSLLIVLVFLVAVAIGVFVFQRFSASGTTAVTPAVPEVTLRVADNNGAKNFVSTSAKYEGSDGTAELKVTIPGNVSITWSSANFDTNPQVYCKSTNFPVIDPKDHDNIAKPAKGENITTTQTYEVACFRAKATKDGVPIVSRFDKQKMKVSIKVTPYLKVYFKGFDNTSKKSVETTFDPSNNLTGQEKTLQVAKGSKISFRYEVSPVSSVRDCSKGSPSGAYEKQADATFQDSVSANSMGSVFSEAKIKIQVGPTPTGAEPPTPTLAPASE